MENYEFLVWFKVFYDANFVEWPVAYNANEERGKLGSHWSTSPIYLQTMDIWLLRN